MTYGNFCTGSLGYQDITILKINRKANAERKGPKIPIASLAVAGSKSDSNNLLVRSEVTSGETCMLGLIFLAMPKIYGGSPEMVTLDGRSSIGEFVTPKQQYVLHHEARWP